jgi:hypothetical protein
MRTRFDPGHGRWTPNCWLLRDTPQRIPNAQWTQVIWEREIISREVKPYRFWDPATPGEFKLPFAGVYSGTASIAWTDNPNGVRRLRWCGQFGTVVNENTFSYAVDSGAVATGDTTNGFAQEIHGEPGGPAGERGSLYVYQDSGVPLDLLPTGVGATPILTIVYAGSL